MNNSQYPVARKNGLVVQEVPDELLVYDLDSNKAHCLNKTAAIVWRSCDGSNSISDIVRLIEKESESSVSEDFVWLAIDQLSENNLLESEIRANFAGASRREAIRKIGLATVVGLPVIASLVAPQNALANVSCTCTAGGAPCPSTGCPGTTCSAGTCVAPRPAGVSLPKKA